jgi:hypothetical protein
MDEAPQPHTATGGMSRGGWLVFIIGGYVLGIIFLGLGLVAGLVLRLPTSWDALIWAIPLLQVTSITLSALTMGKLLHVHGGRQWLLAFGLLTTVLYVVPVLVPPLARLVQGV